MVTPNRVAKLREISGLKRTRIADRLGVSERTVYRWERGDVQIPDDKKTELASIFGGVSVAYLMGWDDQPQHPHDESRAAA